MQTDITPVPTDAAVSPEALAPLQQQLHDVEELTNELKRLLVRHEAALDAEGIRHQVEVLERWMESYRRGLVAAAKISDVGVTWLGELHNKLKLAAEEQQRLEDEGGNPASKEQAHQNDELFKAIKRIEAVMPTIEHLTSPPIEKETEHAA